MFDNNRILTSVLCLLASLALTGQHAAAQTGSDMWVGYAQSRNLFTPHENYCLSSEGFVNVGPNGDGFCIEKAERTAASWTVARQTCADLNKRLPEVAEWQAACVQAASLGLSNMAGNWEWASNFSMVIHRSSSDFGVTSPIVGSASCYDGGPGEVAHYASTSSTNVAFRCVR